MSRSIAFAALSASLLLAACAPKPQQETSLFENPLYAEWYYKDLIENMMNLEIQNDPIVKDASMKSMIQKVRQDALSKAQEATAARQAGQLGLLIPDTQEVRGQVLLAGGKLFFSPDTDIMPGPDLRVYLTPMIDPREGSGSVKVFPDASAVDLGPLQNPYGPSTYALPENLPDIRSVVLWDAKLKRIYAFAQLRTQ
jgi:hypothetical protein